MEHISANQVRASSSRSQHVWEVLTADFQKNKKNIPAVMTKQSARLAGFEPARGDPNRFQVCHLNHSVTVALNYKMKNEYINSHKHWPGCCLLPAPGPPRAHSRLIMWSWSLEGNWDAYTEMGNKRIIFMDSTTHSQQEPHAGCFVTQAGSAILSAARAVPLRPARSGLGPAGSLQSWAAPRCTTGSGQPRRA